MKIYLSGFSGAVLEPEQSLGRAASVMLSYHYSTSGSQAEPLRLIRELRRDPVLVRDGEHRKTVRGARSV